MYSCWRGSLRPAAAPGTAAAAGLAAIGDSGAVPALQALLTDANPHGRLAAARALVMLRATAARGALNAAAQQDSSWAKDELLELARKHAVAVLQAATRPATRRAAVQICNEPQEKIARSCSAR